MVYKPDFCPFQTGFLMAAVPLTFLGAVLFLQHMLKIHVNNVKYVKIARMLSSMYTVENSFLDFLLRLNRKSGFFLH